MFARFTRLPLRRSLHTASTAARSSNTFNRTANLVLGASAVTATYMTWRLTRESNQIALDSAHPSTNAPVVQKSGKTVRPSQPSPEASTSQSSEFAPDLSAGAPATGGFVPDAGHNPPDGSEADGDGSTPQASGGGGTASGGAFNPETGEINWDCPCLGGMAHGPCGPEFREAFSCFVFSEAEPKGINCVEKFQGMQTCFRAHPEVYADEIMDDDDDEPANVEGSADLPPPTQSEENIATETPPPATLEKKSLLHKSPATKDT